MSDKPGPVFDLDTLDAEGAKDPFQFAVQGQRFTIEDPGAMDWRVAASLGNDVRKDLRTLLGKEQFEKFDAIKNVSQRKIQALTEKAFEHFGLGSPGEDES